MKIVLVETSNFDNALKVYTASWRETHSGICSPEFLENRDYAGYLTKKLGSLYLVSDGEPVGVFCLDRENFGDLYIHPNYQGRGYGLFCVRYAKSQTPRLRLTVLSSNAPAIHLYEKSGFRFTGNGIPLREGLWEREMIYTEKHHG